MRVVLEKSVLLKSISHINRVVEKRNTIPILANVLLRAENNVVELKGTDLDLERIERIAAKVEASGSTTVPAATFHNIVSKLADGAEIKLELDDHLLVITSGRSRFTLPVLPEADFPNLTADGFTHEFSLAVDDIHGLIDATQFAISTEETRYYLNGIYLHEVETENGAMLRGVATDGHRLAQSQFSSPKGASDMPGIIIPRKAVAEIFRLADESDEDMKLEVSETKIRATIGDAVLTSKLIDGTFPDYERVIPKNNDKMMVVDRAAFADAVDRVSIIASERGRAVKLELNDNQLVLTVNNPDTGSAVEEVSIKYDSSGLEIGFNAKYLKEMCDQFSEDEMEFMLNDPGSPTLIRAASQPNSLYVLMPMRV